MKRTRIVALACLIVLAALVAVLALRNPQPPLLPGDAEHALGGSLDASVGPRQG